VSFVGGSVKAEHAVKLIAALGSEGFISDKWVTAKCPLAPFNHKTGKDSTPSFGINLESGNFNCFTCSNGSLETLFGEIQMHLSRRPELANRFNLKLAREIIDGIISEVEPLPEFTEFSDKGVEFQEWPHWFIDQYTSALKIPQAADYLLGRGLHKETIEHFDLRVDQAWSRIVCPFRNVFGRLAGARGRAFNPDAKLKHFDYTWNKVNNSGIVLYHEDAIARAVDADLPVIVVEGQFDAHAVFPHHPYVVANLTAKPTPFKLSRLRSCTSGVLIMLDNDETGEEARDLWVRGLRDHTRVGIIDYPPELRLNPKYKDPGSLPTSMLGEMISGV
jgi:DNA primase